MKLFIALFAVCLCLSVFASEADLASSLAETGVALLAKGKPVQAQDAFYKALAHDARCGKALFELAKIYDKQGAKEEASSLYQRALVCSTDTAVRSQASARYAALNPIGSKVTAAFKDYVKGLDAVVMAHPEIMTVDRCYERVRELGLATVLPKDDLPKLSPDGSVNLLALLRNTPGAIPEGWERTDTGIISPASGKLKIQIPYAPPESYEFIVEFRRFDVGGVVGLLTPDKRGVWQLWYHSLDKMDLIGKPEIKPPKMMKVGDKCAMSLAVNGRHMDASFDGKMLSSTDSPSQAQEWILTDNLALGFGIQNCRVEFTSIRVVEKNGTGFVLK